MGEKGEDFFGLYQQNCVLLRHPSFLTVAVSSQGRRMGGDLSRAERANDVKHDATRWLKERAQLPDSDSRIRRADQRVFWFTWRH